MLEIIPVNKCEEAIDVSTDKRIFIENEHGNTMAKKYNYAVENYVLNSKEEIICFRHKDTYIETPLDVCEYKLNKLFADKTVGIAGVIGTIALDKTCTWWSGVPNAGGRLVYGSGSIIQGELDKSCKLIEYPMNDHPGVHTYLATVDGCILWFPKWIFEEGLRFDESLKDYHFYDTDISLQVLERGYKVSTVDIKVHHYSIGKPPKNFDKLKKAFFDKWDKKVDGKWPISRLSEFKKD